MGYFIEKNLISTFSSVKNSLYELLLKSFHYLNILYYNFKNIRKIVTLLFTNKL